MKAGLEKDKAALLVVIGAMADGTKEVLAVVPGFRESAESWAAVLRSLKARGLGVPKLLVADGNLGIWAAARQVWPEAGEQRCWNHKMANVLDRLPKREQAEAKELLRAVVYAPSRAGAERARDAFGDRYADTYPKAVEIPGRRLGPDDRVLRLSRRALEALAHDERGREPVRGGAAAYLRREAVQEGRRCDGADLEAPHGRGEALPEAQRPPPAARGARGRTLRGRPAGPGPAAARGLTVVQGPRSVQRGPPKEGAHQAARLRTGLQTPENRGVRVGRRLADGLRGRIFGGSAGRIRREPGHSLGIGRFWRVGALPRRPPGRLQGRLRFWFPAVQGAAGRQAGPWTERAVSGGLPEAGSPGAEASPLGKSGHSLPRMASQPLVLT